MSPDEVRRAAASGAVVKTEGVEPENAADHHGRLLIGGLVPIAIGAKLSSLSTDYDVELTDEGGGVMGTVCFGTRSIGVPVAEMTRWQFAAYLADANIETLSNHHDFTADYVVIELEFVEKYTDKYMTSAPLWGGFTHDIPNRPYVRPTITPIVAKPGLILPTGHHRRSIRA